MRRPLVKGGQGRTADSLLEGAVLFACALLGVLVLALLASRLLIGGDR